MMNRIRKVLKMQPSLWLLAVLVAGMAVFDRPFISEKNFWTILRQSSIVGLLGCGLLPVMLCGMIDLSIGAFASLGSVLFSMLVSTDYANVPPIIAILMLILICLIMGVVKSVLILQNHIPDFLATIGLSTIISGICSLITNSKIIKHMNESVIFLGQGYVWHIPWPAILCACVMLFCSFVLKCTYVGRHIYAAGTSEYASRLAGINIELVKAFSYIVCTVLAGLCGIVLACRVKGGQATAGDSYQMAALTACVVGGVSLKGGKGTVVNVLCGVLLISTLDNIMAHMNLNAFWQDVVLGGILLLAIALDKPMEKYQSVHLNKER